MLSDATSFDPAVFLGPTGVAVLALFLLFFIGRKFLNDKDRYIERLEDQIDQLLDLGKRSATAAERATTVADKAVEPLDGPVARELEAIRRELAELQRVRKD